MLYALLGTVSYSFFLNVSSDTHWLLNLEEFIYTLITCLLANLVVSIKK